MHDYAEDLRAFIAQLAVPPVLIGWSMGGLVAMMVAESHRVPALVGLAPSTPAHERNPALLLRTGEFDARAYGMTSTNVDDEQPAMHDLDRDERAVALASLCNESQYARDERAAGVVIERLNCPMLIVTSDADDQWPRSRYVAMHLPADYIEVSGASHWGLVLNRRILASLIPTTVSWLDAHLIE